MKAALKAPSPNKWRKRLGNIKETPKASQTNPEPKNEAQAISRTSPRMRLASVARDIVLADLRKE
jgi:hypothetical protein